MRRINLLKIHGHVDDDKKFVQMQTALFLLLFQWHSKPLKTTL